MDQPQPILVRGRCACGKRYRIRNARPGITVMCPNCRRPIPITDADLRAAIADARLIPLQTETVELLEVIPIDFGELTLAPEGSRPGLTGEQALDHEEAMLFRAQRGVMLAAPPHESAGPPPGAPHQSVFVRVELEPAQRDFGGDLLASFYFAGSVHNALNVLAIAMVSLLMGAVAYSVPWMGLLFVFPAWAFFIVLPVQFYWSVLRRTAFGEDRVPLFAVDGSIWHDAIKPTFWLLGVSLLCFVPAWLLNLCLSAAGSPSPIVLLAALGAGWFFWPVAVMSVGLGNSISLLRPDWLVRCVIGIGPAYLIVWGAMLASVAGWFVFEAVSRAWAWAPLVGFAVEAYFAYVVFRTLGLFYRHHHARLPWWF